MHHFLLVPLVSLCLGQGHDDGHGPRLLELLRLRAGITSGEIQLSIHFWAFDKSPEIVGADWDVHYWFQTDQKFFRLDRRRSKELGDGARTASRYAFDGRTFRLIDNDRPNFAIREISKSKPRNVLRNLFDPRALGLYPASCRSLHNFELKDIERLVTGATKWSREPAGHGYRDTYVLPKNGARRFYYFSQDGLPILIEMESEPPAGLTPRLHHEMRLEYDRSAPNPFLMPTRIEFKRYEGERLVIHEEMKAKVIQFNQPIDPSICTWAALKPTVGVPLIENGDSRHMRQKWNGHGFEPYDPRKEALNLRLRAGVAGSSPGNGKTRLVYGLLASSVGLGLMLGYRVYRGAARRRKDPSPSK